MRQEETPGGFNVLQTFYEIQSFNNSQNNGLRVSSDEFRSLPSNNLNTILRNLKNVEISRRQQTLSISRPAAYISNRHFQFNCSTIPLIQVGRKLGFGVTKAGFMGTYNGTSVVVKVFSPNLADVIECRRQLVLNKIATHAMQDRCSKYTQMKIIREILVLHELRHKNIANLLGYCVKGDSLADSDVNLKSVVSVVEYGVPLRQTVTTIRWEKSLQYAKDVALLLKYLQESPLGSVFVHSSMLTHMVSVDGTVKMIDMDRTDNTDVECRPNRTCKYDIPCETKTWRCPGYNAKNAMDVIHKVTDPLLRSEKFPERLRSHISEVLLKINKLEFSTYDLVQALENIESVAIGII